MLLAVVLFDILHQALELAVAGIQLGAGLGDQQSVIRAIRLE
jgi:hypothetical protein